MIDEVLDVLVQSARRLLACMFVGAIVIAGLNLLLAPAPWVRVVSIAVAVLAFAIGIGLEIAAARRGRA